MKKKIINIILTIVCILSMVIIPILILCTVKDSKLMVFPIYGFEKIKDLNLIDLILVFVPVLILWYSRKYKNKILKKISTITIIISLLIVFVNTSMIAYAMARYDFTDKTFNSILEESDIKEDTLNYKPDIMEIFTIKSNPLYGHKKISDIANGIIIYNKDISDKLENNKLWLKDKDVYFDIIGKKEKLDDEYTLTFNATYGTYNDSSKKGEIIHYIYHKNSHQLQFNHVYVEEK